jgi:hypothetical protein
MVAIISEIDPVSEIPGYTPPDSSSDRGARRTPAFGKSLTEIPVFSAISK